MNKRTNTLIVIGIVFLLGGAFVFSGVDLSQLYKAKDTPNVKLRSVPEDYTPEETLGDPNDLDTLIQKKIVDQDWNLENYYDVESSIRNSYKNHLINETDKELLMKKLELAYVGALNRATKGFFKNIKSDKYLSLLAGEISTYYNISEYKKRISGASIAISHYYKLKKVRNRAMNKINASTVYEDLEEMILEIDRLKDKSYLKGSGHTQNMAEKSRNNIVKEMTSRAINAYKEELAIMSSDEGSIHYLIDELEAFNTKEYISGRTSTQQFYGTEKKKLLDRLAQIKIDSISPVIDEYLQTRCGVSDVEFVEDELGKIKDIKLLENNQLTQIYINEKETALIDYRGDVVGLKNKVLFVRPSESCLALFPENKGCVIECKRLREEERIKQDSVIIRKDSVITKKN